MHVGPVPLPPPPPAPDVDVGVDVGVDEGAGDEIDEPADAAGWTTYGVLVQSKPAGQDVTAASEHDTRRRNRSGTRCPCGSVVVAVAPFQHTIVPFVATAQIRSPLKDRWRYWPAGGDSTTLPQHSSCSEVVMPHPRAYAP